MNKFNFTWGVLIAALVLLFYTYMAFNGSLYLDVINGHIWISILLALAIVSIVSLCVFVMCRAKATRWKGIGTIGQLVFGAIILAVFCIGGIPFASFLNAANNQTEINKEIIGVQKTAIDLDQAYSDYVDVRIDNYKQKLEENHTLLENAAGKDDETKISNLAQSLRNRIFPPSVNEIQQKRHDWLHEIKGLSIWNIETPKNLSYLTSCVQEWVTEYNTLSSIQYEGEDVDTFTYALFQEKLDNLRKDLGEVHYSIWSIIVAVICSAFMLLPYFLTQGSLAGFDGTTIIEKINNKDKEQPKYE